MEDQPIELLPGRRWGEVLHVVGIRSSSSRIDAKLINGIVRLQ